MTSGFDSLKAVCDAKPGGCQVKVRCRRGAWANYFRHFPPAAPADRVYGEYAKKLPEAVRFSFEPLTTIASATNILRNVLSSCLVRLQSARQRKSTGAGGGIRDTAPIFESW